MSFIRNIQSVARYESKLLRRSWFFRVFTVLAVLFLGLFMSGLLLMDDDGDNWVFKTIPSNIPYMTLLLLNTGQAIIAIFLASDFLKRDKKLDTSEVFYVHSLSNAEYVFGKIWGNLRVFLLLNFIVMALVMVINVAAGGALVDWVAYPMYFLIICLPTLIFIIGLSIFLMLVLRNQALTFVILLGYIGLTLFYIGNKFYYAFDYMAYSLPLLKSTITGFTNADVILNHRAIYLLMGLACIFFTVALFNRLPNSRRSNYPWVLLGICALGGSLFAGYNHVHSILEKGTNRALYTSINNKYVATPKMVIEQYDISFEQQPHTLVSEARLKGIALQTSSVFAFCLNPGLQVTAVTQDGQDRPFTREQQILLVNLPKEAVAGDTVTLSIRYNGRLDEDFCYLDIPEEVLQKEYREFLLNIDKKYLFQTPDYLLFTPETYWYPRPGIAFSDKNPDWQQTYFSRFSLQVKPLPGLVPVSQGEGIRQDDGSYSFLTDHPAQAITLTIGNYRRKSLQKDSVEYNVWYIDGHDYLTAELDSIQDTIPGLINEVRDNMQRATKLSYPFKRFSVIEAPTQFYSYERAWSQAQEVVQPEMVFLPEKGWLFDEFNFGRRWKKHIEWEKRNGRNIDEKEAKILAMRNMLSLFQRMEGKRDYGSGGRGEFQVTVDANPYYLFPEFYNFRYNIYSSEWPVSNRIVELYLQNKSDQWNSERDVNGISNNEKANLLLGKHTFKELLGDIENRDLQTNLIGQQAKKLFAGAERKMGTAAFRDSLYAVLNRNAFRNIRFEQLIETMEQISHSPIQQEIKTWNRVCPLPYYSFGRPELTRTNRKGKEVFVLKQLVSNDSDTDGVLQVDIQVGNWNAIPDPKTSRKVGLEAHQSKQLVSVWDEAPREVVISTLVSDNLPSIITLPIRHILEDNNKAIEQEGDFTVEHSASDKPPGEVIVDNEDPLFSLSKPAVVGLLPSLLDKVADTRFKYVGIAWNQPLQWVANTNGNYYGTHIRSAYVVKSGDGSQTATWRLPVPDPGHYEIYYWSFAAQSWGDDRQDRREFHFKIQYNGETEDAYLDVKRASGEWEQLGVYYLDTDTVRVVLTNESKSRLVTADAVRMVKRQ